MIKQTNSYLTLNQGVLPMFISDCLDICDPVFTFDELIGGLDLDKYLKNVPEHKLGRIGYNPVRMLKTVLFGFMDEGYISLRNLEANCRVNVRYMYLMDRATPSYRTFNFLYRKPLKGNQYGRKEEVYQCEDYSGCPFASKCKKTDGNRTVRINEELTAMHQEVIDNLESIQGALLRMNRSIQAEGTFGIIKKDRWYKRIVPHKK